MHRGIVVIGILALALWGQSVSASDATAVAEEIRLEATRSNTGPEGRPLPLASHWNTGTRPEAVGWGPAEQMQWIEQGHFVLPWFEQPPRDARLADDAMEAFVRAYEDPIKKARVLRLPITLVGPQWEEGLSRDPYLGLPPDQNPNVVTRDGTILPQLSPFGPLQPWRELGRTWTDNPQMRLLQQWYPDPPLVIFLSNNEAPKLRWPEVEKDRRYLDAYGEGRDDDFRAKAVGDGWIARYRAFQAAMREGLTSRHWQQKAIFVGYDAFGPPHFGRWDSWGTDDAIPIRGRISPSPLMWDGGSPSYYTHNWNASTDYRVWSPQVEFMNLVFMQKEAYRLNPEFWYEFSVWDGYEPGEDNDKRLFYQNQGQAFTPERYGGFVQFGMWLMRPRAVREYRDWNETWKDCGPFFMALVAAVDRVHTNATLREWWRYGELVPNRARLHPYQQAIPEEYRGADRWFLLETDANDPESFSGFADSPDTQKEIGVFALALTRGSAPERRWLVYAHSPLAERDGVRITVPGYGDVTVHVSVAGSFYLIDERTGIATPVNSPPAT